MKDTARKLLHLLAIVLTAAVAVVAAFAGNATGGAPRSSAAGDERNPHGVAGT
ncbi:hypothetical protein KFK09_011998 [Dendrobium nobile]|uniref:Uncharacterized protein n=1 Tax=Dendrobium nobile TaxID=94219 RepID=A0A8T3BJP9_DENNO|nr:hypothetical protein KFK09_011998 [Dendrobium nobile]